MLSEYGLHYTYPRILGTILYREGATQKELAEKLGMNKQHISDMERDRRSISKKTAKELAGIFKVSPVRFI